MVYYGALLGWFSVVVLDHHFDNRPRDRKFWTVMLSTAILMTGSSIAVSRCKPLWSDGNGFVYGSRNGGTRFSTDEVVRVRGGKNMPLEGISLLRIETTQLVGYTVIDGSELDTVIGKLVPDPVDPRTKDEQGKR